MVDISLKSNIKKNLTKTAVSTKQNETKAKETAKTTAAQTSVKTTAKQVVSSLTSGTASVSKTVETLKNELKTPVTATKTENKTTLTTKVDNKSVTITTNENIKNVPITVSDSKIATAKTLDTGLTTKSSSTTDKPVLNGKTSGTVLNGKTLDTGLTTKGSSVTDKPVLNGKTGGIVLNGKTPDIGLRTKGSAITNKPELNGITGRIALNGKLAKTLPGNRTGGRIVEPKISDKIGFNHVTTQKNTPNTDIITFESFYAEYKNIFKGLSKQDMKDVYSVMSSISKGEVPDEKLCVKIVDILSKLDEDSINAFYEFSCGSSTNTSGHAQRRAPGKGEPAVGHHGEYGGDGWFGDYGTDGYVSLGDCLAHEWDIHGGMETWNGKGAEEMATGVILGALIEYSCLNTAHGVTYLGEKLYEGIKQAGENLLAKFVIYPNNNNNGKNGGTTGGNWGNYGTGGAGNDYNGRILNDSSGGKNLWSQGFDQYGEHTVVTGKGTVTFEPWTVIGTSESDDGGFDAVFGDSDGNPIVVTNSNGNGSSTLDGLGGANHHQPGDDWTDANGTQHHMNDDGTVTSTYKNGEKITWDPNEGKTTEDANGTTSESTNSTENDKTDNDDKDNDDKDNDDKGKNGGTTGGGGGGDDWGFTNAGWFDPVHAYWLQDQINRAEAEAKAMIGDKQSMETLQRKDDSGAAAWRKW